jgi:membrane protease YdiL (CAAX protease family)
MYAFFPGLLLLTLGTRPRELGLCLPARQTLLATQFCPTPVLSFVSWGVATGRREPAALFWLLMHNFFSNGFTEEFLCRGMILSHLRTVFETGWAQLGEAVAFALLHFHPTGVEEKAAPLEEPRRRSVPECDGRGGLRLWGHAEPEPGPPHAASHLPMGALNGY